jgi:hypothetical protein
MGKLGELLMHPEEFLPLVGARWGRGRGSAAVPRAGSQANWARSPFPAQAKMYYASQKACKLPSDPKLAFCYDILNSVSRRCAPRCSAPPAPPRAPARPNPLAPARVAALPQLCRRDPAAAQPAA